MANISSYLNQFTVNQLLATENLTKNRTKAQACASRGIISTPFVIKSFPKMTQDEYDAELTRNLEEMTKNRNKYNEGVKEMEKLRDERDGLDERVKKGEIDARMKQLLDQNGELFIQSGKLYEEFKSLRERKHE